MAGNRYKCKLCGEWIEPDEERVAYKKGYVHTKCFNVAVMATVTKKDDELKEKRKHASVVVAPQKEVKAGLSEEEYQEKVNLCDYLRNLLHTDLSVKIYKLMDDYHRKQKISYKDMQDDLIWYFEICGNPVEGDAIGIIPYHHDDAQKYYTSIKRSNDSCRKHIKDLPEMYKETKVAMPVQRARNIQQIDIASIGGDSL